MKKYLLITGLFFLLISFTGCYTVIWSPEMDFPTEETYQEEYYYDNYYPDNYYGSYGYYYQYPWWLSITPPTTSAVRSNRDDNNTMEKIRNRDGSRNTSSRNSGAREQIINNDPVTQSGSSGSSGSTSKDNSKTEVRDSGSSSNSGSSSRSSSSGDSNNTRNSNGGRNNGGRR